MTRLHLLPTVFIAATALTGCAYVKTTPLAAARYPAVAPDSVRFFATSAPAKYVEIAMMRVQGFVASDRRSARALRETAGKLGANGIILLNARGAQTHRDGDVAVVIGGRHEGGAVIFGNGDEAVKEFERAVAIRYEPDPAVASGAEPAP